MKQSKNESEIKYLVNFLSKLVFITDCSFLTIFKSSKLRNSVYSLTMTLARFLAMTTSVFLGYKTYQ